MNTIKFTQDGLVRNAHFFMNGVEIFITRLEIEADVNDPLTQIKIFGNVNSAEILLEDIESHQIVVDGVVYVPKDGSELLKPETVEDKI